MAQNHPFEETSMEETLKQLNANKETGLSSEEAQKRLAEHGPNSLEVEKVSLWKKLIPFFWGPIPWMIEIAAILSAALQRWPDFIMIMAMLLINSTLGFFQEYKADNAIAALKEKLALKARVMRDGQWSDIAAKDLVPGDIVYVKLGNILPADLKLLSGEYLSVDQSSLTGESLPVDKQVGDLAFSGTVARLGEMVGVVTTTGMQTFFGQTAQLVSSAKTKSHLQQAVVKIGNFLIFTTITVSLIILIGSLFRMHTVTQTEIGHIAIFILVLVIAGIPVALPAVLSVTMAVGASRLADEKAIVSKLTSIEELAGMDILCADKTGTLTQNHLTVGDIDVYEAKDPKEVLLIASLSSKLDAKDAIDDAIIDRFGDRELLKQYQCEQFIPFDPVRKRTEALIIAPDGKKFHAVKGAPQIVLELTNPNIRLEDAVLSNVVDLAERGFRSLCVAILDSATNEWRFLGIIPLFDPPRPDTKQTAEHAASMGIKVKMITGDHVAIARELSSQLELGKHIVPVDEVYADHVPSRTRDELLESGDGFAEVFPTHKFEIVKTLQRNGHIVGMTGDGVNDAPALKQADVGIAVEGATDAARAAADLVLTQPGLSVISRAIEESRKIFGRMKSYAMYRISETLRLILFLLLSMLVFNDHPLSAIMIVLIALLNDIPIMMIAYDHMPIPKKPVVWRMKEILTIAIGLSIAGVVSTFLLYWIGDRIWFAAMQVTPAYKFAMLRTLAFMAILCGGNLTIYLTRNMYSIFHKPHPEWRFFLATIIPLIAGTLASVYGLGTSDFVGIGWKYVIYSWIYILIWFILCMLVKMWLYKLIGYEDDVVDDPYSGRLKEKIQ